MSLFPTTYLKGNADGSFTKIGRAQFWAETMAAAVAEAFAEEPEPAKPKTLKEIMAEAKKAKKKR